MTSLVSAMKGVNSMKKKKTTVLLEPTDKPQKEEPTPDAAEGAKSPKGLLKSQ